MSLRSEPCITNHTGVEKERVVGHGERSAFREDGSMQSRKKYEKWDGKDKE